MANTRKSKDPAKLTREQLIAEADELTREQLIAEADALARWISRSRELVAEADALYQTYEELGEAQKHVWAQLVAVNAELADR